MPNEITKTFLKSDLPGNANISVFFTEKSALTLTLYSANSVFSSKQSETTHSRPAQSVEVADRTAVQDRTVQ